MNIQEPDYLIDYKGFMSTYKLKQISGEEVGALVAKMGEYYAMYNLKYASATRAYNAVKSGLQGQIDSSTAKAMSTSKAEILASSTPEGDNYTLFKTHVENCEQLINALKALQKGVLLEYSNAT